jgi:DNA-binding MarR family transcriptional regulator
MESMSTESGAAAGLSTNEAIRAMLLLMPRVAARLKRTRIPDRLQAMNLAPRHLSLLSYLLFDGPMAVNELAARLEVAPTTVSLMVSDLGNRGILQRQEDPGDRRRAIVAITDDPEIRSAIDSWLAAGATAWRKAFDPLTPEERAVFVKTIAAYEAEASGTVP